MTSNRPPDEKEKEMKNQSEANNNSDSVKSDLPENASNDLQNKQETKTTPDSNEADENTETRQAEENLHSGTTESERSGEKIKDKASEIAEDLLSKLKIGFEQAVKTSTRVIEDLSETAQKYAEKYKTEIRIKQLNDERKSLCKELGQYAFQLYREKKLDDKTFSTDPSVQKMINEIKRIDQQIVELGKQLDNNKK
ncbi:MAG: YtxH domain-containing protein [Calditrichaeota bacterium]|nr:MAG: YtxH domain-containing protein [Calditrichota bacterium]